MIFVDAMFVFWSFVTVNQPKLFSGLGWSQLVSFPYQAVNVLLARLGDQQAHQLKPSLPRLGDYF